MITRKKSIRLTFINIMFVFEFQQILDTPPISPPHESPSHLSGGVDVIKVITINPDGKLSYL